MRADDIVRQRFTKVFRGYDVQEVDVFLDEVIRTLDEMERERNVLLSRVEALLNELDRYDALLHNGAATMPDDAYAPQPARQYKPKTHTADIPATQPAAAGNEVVQMPEVAELTEPPQAAETDGFQHNNPLEEPPQLVQQPGSDEMANMQQQEMVAEAANVQTQKAAAETEDEEIDLSAIFPEDYVQPDPSQEPAAEPEPPEGQN